ncbi:hypothetical protein [Azospirillum sp. SYSU D00513]|uniref:hypothetical protein n=1 Tax=Azospirillum sp. SYSU D00513 TaxID=2812561 RepID=UPI001A96B5A9|nr:hypothetical protein [Azospirillum sp. SYSU D00513]
MKKLICLSAALLISACAGTPIPLQTEYQGQPTVSAQGEKVRLLVEAQDHTGKPYPADSLLASQYRTIAESGFKKAGYVLTADADTQLRVSVRGRTTNGIVDNQSNVGRNLATGVLTMGIACKEMDHVVDAAGEVSLVRNGQTIAAKQIDMQRTETSCFSTLNPSWVANQQEAAVRTYEHAANDHVGKVLEFVSTTR